MGNRKGNKNDKKKGKGKEEGKTVEGKTERNVEEGKTVEGKTERNVMNLIKKVDINEKGFLEFPCVTPSDAEMNNKFIPQLSVDTPSINWFSDRHNLTKMRNPEWAEAWDQFCISKGFGWYEGAFSSQPEEVQKEGIKYMVDFVRKTRRSLMYKKYEYALQRKKKEEDEIDELNRQVEVDLEFIEGQKDKGKGKKTEKEQAKIDKGKGISIREGKRADWSTAEDDDGDDVDDNTTPHGGGESAKSDGESGERKTVDEAKEDEGAVEVAGAEEKEKEEVEEKVGADEGRVDNTVGSLVTPSLKTLFPVYEDGDNVVCYEDTFSLKDWLLGHKSLDSRWLPSCPDMGLNNVRWNGDRLKRESLTVMQSLLSVVLDYHEQYGPHGNLSNHANIILSQHVDSFGGYQKVWFQIQLSKPISLEPKILNDQFEVTTYLNKDMLEVDRVFRKILEGRDLDTDLEYLLTILLKRYPFNDKEAWRTQVLRNFPGFWYGQQRASFIINVYYNWMCDSEKSAALLRAIQYVRSVGGLSPDLKCFDWIKKISTDSIFYKTLIFTSKVFEDKEDDDPKPQKPQYSEGSAEKVLKYMRDTLHPTDGGDLMKIHQIELYLSNLFKGESDSSSYGYTMRNTPITTRQRVMLKLQELIRRDMDKLAMNITTEQGKTLKDAEGDVFRGLEVVEHACGMATLQMGEYVPNVSSGIDTYSLREPLGVCAGILCPFNFPAMIPLWMFPVAVICGNTFDLKPSEKDPGASMILAELAMEAGIPDGVLNIDNVNAICDDDDIRAISFVGSNTVSDPVIGLYEEGTHNVVDIPDCKAHHPNINAAVDLLRKGMTELNIQPYDEDQGSGLLRYVQMAVTTYNTSLPASERYKNGKVQVSLVWNTRNENSPFSEKLDALSKFLWRYGGPDSKSHLIHSVWANFQTSSNNIIFGNRWRHLLGERDLWEHVGGIDVSMAPSSFGQANTRAFDSLLRKLHKYVPYGTSVTDLYAGAGVIGLSLAARRKCRSVKCVEVNKESKLSFEKTAERLPLSVDSSISWHHADTAIEPLSWLVGSDVVVVDPPRKGLDPSLVNVLQNISLAERKMKLTGSPVPKVKDEKRPWVIRSKEASLQIRSVTVQEESQSLPQTLIYISCGWDSFKEDCKLLLSSKAWHLDKTHGFNFFPGTQSIEVLAVFKRGPGVGNKEKKSGKKKKKKSTLKSI